MLFSISKLGWLLTQPGNLLVAGLAAGGLLVLWAAGRRGADRAGQLGRWLLTGAITTLVLLFWFPVGVWLLRPLETRFVAPEPPAQVDGIIVLGGAVDPILSSEHGQPVLTDGAERLFALAALSRRYPDARILYTGGSGSLRSPGLREVSALPAILEGLGVPARRVVLEGDSRNTHENAAFGLAAMRPGPGEIWLLVTSAYHMPRAVGVFRKAGWAVQPWPIDYRTSAEQASLPALDLAWSLALFELAVHEWLGLAAYWWLGRTGTLFPG